MFPVLTGMLLRHHVRRRFRLLRRVRPTKFRLLRQVRPTKVILLAGLALIAVGILCLSLSGAVARTGTWWQGTWQALGVGFVVGGIVDVLAIALISHFSSAWQGRWNDLAERLLRFASARPDWDVTAAARLLLEDHGDEINQRLRRKLRELADAPRRVE